MVVGIMGDLAVKGEATEGILMDAWFQYEVVIEVVCLQSEKSLYALTRRD